MAQRLGAVLLSAICLALVLPGLTFQDPISFIGRLKWNYTRYEENLWVREYENTTLAAIYTDHERYLATEFGETEVFEQVLPQMPRIVSSIAEIKGTWKLCQQMLQEKEYDDIRQSSREIIRITTQSMNIIFSSTDQQFYLDYLKKKSYGCKNVTTPSGPATQTLIEVYFTEMIAALLKSYILIQLAYLTLASTEFVTSQRNARDLRTSFAERFAVYTADVEDLSWRISRTVWNCDDVNPDSYLEITNFLQGYVDNEINLNLDGNCLATCSDYKDTMNYDCRPGTYCALNYLDKNKSRCEGVVRDCGPIAWDMNICANENDTITDKRYNFIKSSSGEVWGQEEYCPDQIPIKGWHDWFVACSYCFCYCDVSGPLSDRHFSLEEVVSNIHENKVVGGVKLSKTNGTIHWEILERTFLADGLVNVTETPVKWISNLTAHPFQYEEDENYHSKIITLNYENRSIGLDTVIGSSDEVVTGVRFRPLNGRLQLEVQFTYFDRLTGRLDTLSESRWKANNFLSVNKLPHSQGDVPTNFEEQSVMNLDVAQYVEFDPANVQKNIAQSTVPFVEGVAVEPYEPAALSGVGIYYKTLPGSGGIVGAKVVIHDPGMLTLHVRAAVGVYGIV